MKAAWWALACALALGCGDKDGGGTVDGGEETGTGEDTGTVDSGEETTEVDADGDGHTTATDCDDADPEVHPDAEEVCGDGVDNDCDGQATGCGPSGTTTTHDLTVSHSDTIGSYAYGTHRFTDLDGDGATDLVTSNYGAELGSGDNNGVTWVVYGPLPTELVIPTDAHAALGGPTEGKYSAQAIATGDVDGDGFVDVVIDSRFHPDPGAVHVVWGGPDRFDGDAMLDELGSTQVTTIGGTVDDGYFGDVLRVVGDLDGDGAQELWVSAPDAGTDSTSVAWLIPGSEVRTGTHVVDVARLALHGEPHASDNNDIDELGEPLDLDGDGVDDLVGAGLTWTDDFSKQGAVFVLLGASAVALSGEHGWADVADAAIYGGSESQFMGHSVAPVGDTDGDGYADLGVGAPFDSEYRTSAGRAFVFAGSATAWSGERDGEDAASGGIYGINEYDLLGFALDGDDVDADGAADLWVGVPGADDEASAGGLAALFYGPLTGWRSASTADASLVGTETNGQLGLSVALADHDNDGVPDLIAGAQVGPELLGLLSPGL